MKQQHLSFIIAQICGILGSVLSLLSSLFALLAGISLLIVCIYFLVNQLDMSNIPFLTHWLSTTQLQTLATFITDNDHFVRFSIIMSSIIISMVNTICLFFSIKTLQFLRKNVALLTHHQRLIILIFGVFLFCTGRIISGILLLIASFTLHYIQTKNNKKTDRL